MPGNKSFINELKIGRSFTYNFDKLFSRKAYSNTFSSYIFN